MTDPAGLVDTGSCEMNPPDTLRHIFRQEMIDKKAWIAKNKRISLRRM
jgi:hypothetical protein